MGTPKYDSISLKIFTIRDIDEANSRTHHQFLGPFGENFRKYLLLLPNKCHKSIK
jgi:hypothetical protein